MGHKSYSEKLKDPRWQAKREKIINRDNGRCVSCERSDVPLQVHHGAYLRFTEPWDHPDELLWTLCESCHRDTENYLLEIRLMLGFIKPCLLAGMMHRIRREVKAELFGSGTMEMHELDALIDSAFLNGGLPWGDHVQG